MMFQHIALHNDQIYIIIIAITSNVYHIFKDWQNLLFLSISKSHCYELYSLGAVQYDTSTHSLYLTGTWY